MSQTKQSQSATQSKQERPLSPHLQIYRPQMTSVLSILHRMTGAANAGGLILFALWLVAIMYGPELYTPLTMLLSTLVGQIILVGWSFSLFYHLCNGIRHLIWDSGRLFKIRHATLAGYLVLVTAIGLTASLWSCLYIYKDI